MKNLTFSDLFLVPLLSFLPGACGYVGVLNLDALYDLVHVQRAFAGVTQDNCLILDLRLQLLDLLWRADMGKIY